MKKADRYFNPRIVNLFELTTPASVRMFLLECDIAMGDISDQLDGWDEKDPTITDEERDWVLRATNALRAVEIKKAAAELRLSDLEAADRVANFQEAAKRVLTPEQYEAVVDELNRKR